MRKVLDLKVGELAEKMLSGKLTLREKQEIQKELVEGNLRFVITVSKQYQNQGLDLPDLIAEGNYGLLKAIENFDWSKKLRFISYAVWWVRQSILQSLNENARTIRLPVNVVQELHKAKKDLDLTGTNYNKTTIMPKVKETLLADDKAAITSLLENQPNPMEVFKKYSYDEMKQALQEWLTPEDEYEEGAIIDDEKEEEVIEKPSKTYSIKTPVKEQVSKADKFDALFEEEDDDLPF